MSKKVKLTVLTGQRENLENQIPHALFTIFDEKELDNKLAEINGKLAPKGELKLVSVQPQITQDER